MYNEDVTRIPVDEDDMWDILEEQFSYVRHVLWELPVETKQDALDNKYHIERGQGVERSGMAVIRYRDTGNELDQRDHFLSMGRELLPYIDWSIDERKLTPEFVQQWGKIMFCHGYIASYVFDDTDDVALERNRTAGGAKTRRTAQHVFLARLLLHLMDKEGQTRQQSEGNAANLIQLFIEVAQPPDGYDLNWFRRLLSKDKEKGGNMFRIVATMSQHNAPEHKLRELAGMEIDGVPPITLLLRSP